VYTRAALMDQEARLPERTKVYVIPEERSSDVDTELDFKLLECMMAIGNQRDETR
jgi:CMP-N-acetylneuraminic acid synthetase